MSPPAGDEPSATERAVQAVDSVYLAALLGHLATVGLTVSGTLPFIVSISIARGVAKVVIQKSGDEQFVEHILTTAGETLSPSALLESARPALNSIIQSLYRPHNGTGVAELGAAEDTEIELTEDDFGWTMVGPVQQSSVTFILQAKFRNPHLLVRAPAAKAKLDTKQLHISCKDAEFAIKGFDVRFKDCTIPLQPGRYDNDISKLVTKVDTIINSYSFWCAEGEGEKRLERQNRAKAEAGKQGGGDYVTNPQLTSQLAAFYNKTEVGNLLNAKMDKFDLTLYATKSYTDSGLAGKMNTPAAGQFKLAGSENAVTLLAAVVATTEREKLNPKIQLVGANIPEAGNPCGINYTAGQLRTAWHQWYGGASATTRIMVLTDTGDLQVNGQIRSSGGYRNLITSDLADYYTKNQIIAGYYTREELNQNFQSRGNYALSADVYKKTEIYTRAETDAKVSSSISAANITAGSGLLRSGNTISLNPTINSNVVLNSGDILVGNYLYVRGAAGSGDAGRTGGIAFEYDTGGYKHWIVSRHHGGQVSGNAIDFWLSNQPNAGQYGATALGVQSTRHFIIDASAVVVVPAAPFRVHQGIEMNGGNINLPAIGASIRWGNNVSRIYDDGDLHVETDDFLHFDCGSLKDALYMNRDGFNKFQGGLQTTNSTVNLGFGTPTTQGLWMFWNRSGGQGESVFMNQRGGGGAGGFEWQNWSNSNTFENTSMRLDPTGNLSLAADFFMDSSVARINLGPLATRAYIGSVPGDSAGDFHIYDGPTQKILLGYYRNSNTVRLGDSNSTLLVGDRRVLTLPSITRTGETLLDLGGRISFTNENSNGVGAGMYFNSTSGYAVVAVFTGKSTTARDAQYRYTFYGGSGTSGGSINYTAIFGGTIVANNAMQVFSDIRNKRQVQGYDEEKALGIVKAQRSVRFKYLNSEEQKQGFIAQELLNHEYVKDTVGLMSKPGGNPGDDRYVHSSDQMVPILWAALRALTARLEKLKVTNQKKALQALKTARVVSYKSDQQVRYGWVESELAQGDLKSLVSSSKNGDVDMYAVDQAGLTAHLHAAVKELTATTESQQRQIDWIVSRANSLGLWGTRPT
ncbi:hypothetical protein HK097_009558 [Rhizophlyctis rosea]|uniref:Peptidase S74 domain-containing protein n=1 Tax=Rhizophlyctis rosea TaxID=64517 RepID=A0AAD5SAZ9_9FUNG|nr:hypothetical protein HK097_009558 [Rhizophlyctis rosea]